MTVECREADGEEVKPVGPMEEVMYDPRWLRLFEARSRAGDPEAPAL